MRKADFINVILSIVISCSSVKNATKNLAVDTDIHRRFNQSSLYNSQFTGFSLFDIQEDKFIAGYNDTKRFTPASNAKVLTMYTALKSFQDALPALLYQAFDDSLLVQPIGDPTFLHPKFPKQTSYELLSNYQSIRITWPVNEVKAYGPGWSWEDYVYSFQPQRSWWPAYGNRTDIIKKDDSIRVVPPFFTNYVEVNKKKKTGELVKRNLKYNLFSVYTDNDTSDFKRTIPFDYSKELLTQLLTDTLSAEVRIAENLMIAPDTLFTYHVDSVLAPMMIQSDNFLAEQLLLVSAWKNGYTSFDAFLKHIKLIWFTDINDFVWVDGSGLSRYNLIAPVDMVRILKKASEEFGFDRIKNLMAVGGQSGTLTNWYAAEEPYIFAKTGTLSNNHNLSGFLKTKSGKWLIFSFMNNHFTVPLATLKAEMQALLEEIRDTY
ncbi:MAG: D-alanyl-D-alanine carboxypeptidase [Bacteroidota bacterium]